MGSAGSANKMPSSMDIDGSTLVLIDNHVPGPGGLGHFGVLGRSRTLFSRFDWPARAGLKKNARLRARFSRFFARTWPPGLDFGRSRTSPGSFWEAETPRFSSFFVAPARSVLTSCEVYKTLAGATFFTHRSFRATTQKHRKIVLRARSTVLDAPNALGHRSGAVRERLGSVPGTFLDGSWPLLARPGRPKIGLGAIFGRPRAVPSAS